MRVFSKKIAIFATMALTLIVPVGRASAQDAPTTVAMVAIAPLDRLLQDIAFLLRAANFPEVNGIVSIMVNQYTNGLDRSRPLGVIVKIQDGQPTPLAFLPVSNRADFFAALELTGIVADDVGNGMFAFEAAGKSLFVKESSGWLFVGQDEKGLNNLPANPATPIDALAKRYDLAVRVNIQQLPEDLRNMAIDQMKTGFERSLAEQSNASDEERALNEEVGKASLAQIERMIQETEEVFLGWGVEASNHKTFIDTGVQFVSGSELAKQVEMSKDLATDFSGLILADAALSARGTSLIPETDKTVAKNNLRNLKTQAEKQIDSRDSVDPAIAAAAKKFLAAVMDVLGQTIDEGKMDIGATVTLADNKLRAIIGGHVANGKTLEKEIKDFVGALGSVPNLPKFEFDYATHNGVSLHRITAPLTIADPEAEKIFGEQATIIVGTSEKKFYISLDSAGDALIKQGVDNVQAHPNVKRTPSEMTLHVGQVLEFAQYVKPNPMLDIAIQTIQKHKANDKVQIESKVLARGLLYRLSIDEGVIQAIGTSAKQGAGGGGAGF